MSKFWSHFTNISEDYQIEFGQGNTPLIDITNKDSGLFIKDETQNPNGSFKDRGLAYQLSYHLQQGKKSFALSSSGNAAITASYLAKYLGIGLHLFISNSIDKEKFQILDEFAKGQSNIKLYQGERPRSALIKFLNSNKDVTNLRGSTDVNASLGYKSIAFELAEQIPAISTIFIPTSSGTSAVGIHQGFTEINKNVQIHICQTTKVNSITKYFDSNFTISKVSLSDAITDKVAHRKEEVVQLIKKTNGFGWTISDTELLFAKAQLSMKELPKQYSYNSLLSYAGFLKAKSLGYNFTNPVLLFSGR